MFMLLLRRLPLPWSIPGRSRAATTAALFCALFLVPFAKGQAIEGTFSLTPEQQQVVAGLLELDPAESRQQFIEYSDELLQFYGEMDPLLDHLLSLEQNNAIDQLLAVAALANGDLALALQSLDRLASQPDPELWTLAKLAQVLEIQGNDSKAIAALQRALDETTDSSARFALLVRKAQLHYDKDQQEEARKALRDILSEPGFDQPGARNYCGRIASLHGDYELVEQLFIPIGEGNALMRDQIFFGQILYRLGKPDEAREQFEAALKLAKVRRDRRYILDRIVSAARLANQLPDLMDQWLAANQIWPEQLEILTGILGGELDRAQDILALLERQDLPKETRKAIQSPEFQERLVMVALETGHSELALKKYRELVESHPTDYYYHNGYVRLLLMDGDWDQAKAFLRKTIAATKTAGGLMDLATIARSLALQDVAMEAATKAGAMGDQERFHSLLFEAELHHQQGETDTTLKILRSLELESGNDPERLNSLSLAYERYDYNPDAIRLLTRAYELSKSERLLEKLIALMEIEQQHDQLYPLWRKLWETAAEPMAIIQAQDRVLDLASKKGLLADIAIELEERFDQGELTDKELTMLMEIYTSVNDPVSAAEILLEMASKQQESRIATYQRMVQVYTECELFGRCNALLRKLIKIDPDNREDYMQTLTLIALERKNHGDALDALGELTASSPGGVLRDSFSASVLNMIGYPQQAARIYRRGLADHPDEVETWLLWANALKASGGQKKKSSASNNRKTISNARRAGNFFCVLAEETTDDDLFTIAVDGLLNVEAGRNTLRHALRRINERIAVKPHKMFLYRLAADLYEETEQKKRVRMMLEQGLCIADDERTIILRELIALANNQDEVIRLGRTLLNTAEHLPPGECLELGTILLNKGLFSEADGAFQRVITGGDIMGVTRDIMVRYENIGLFGKANKLLRGLLITSPFDESLLLRLGVIEEKKANYAAAGKAYKQALDLMLGRLPRQLKNNGSSGRSSRNIEETTQYYELAVKGLMVSARTSDLREQLLATTDTLVKEELKGIETDNAFGKTLKENPRLLRLSDLMRRLGISFHRPEYFDPMDDDLLQRYPQDPSLLVNLANQRKQWGMSENANQFFARNAEVESGALVISPYLDNPKQMEDFLSGQSLDSDELQTVLPILALCGHTDAADRVLAENNLAKISKNKNAPLFIAGLTMDRPDLVRQALFENLDLAQNDVARAYNYPFQEQIIAAWPILTEAERISATDQVGAIAKKMSHRKERMLSFYHYLLCLTGRSQEIREDALAEYVKIKMNSIYDQSHTRVIILRWLLDQPMEQRSEALRQLVKPPKTQALQARMLLELALLLEETDFDDHFAATFKELLVPSAMTGVAREALYLILIGYHQNSLTDYVRESMSTYSGDIQAIALADRATEEIKDKIPASLKGGIPQFKSGTALNIRNFYSYQSSKIRQVALALTPEQFDSVLEGYRDSNQPADMAVLFLLLKYAGREVEALAVLHKISALPPEDPNTQSIRTVLPLILNDFGWYAQSQLFREDIDEDPPSQVLMDFHIFDSLALLDSSAENTVEASTRRLYATLVMNDPLQFLQAARIYHADKRNPSVISDRQVSARLNSWPPQLVKKPGGLLGLDVQTGGTVLSDLGNLDSCQDELGYWLRAMPSNGNRLQQSMCRVMAVNIARQGLSSPLEDTINHAADHSLLNRVDLQTTLAMAAKAPSQLPESLADHMNGIILYNQYTPSYIIAKTAALSEVCELFGLDRMAVSLGLWSVVNDVYAKGSSWHLTNYLEHMPREKRPDAIRKLLPYLGMMNGIRMAPGGDDANLFSALLDAGMREEAETTVDMYLKRLRIAESTFYEPQPNPYYSHANGVSLQDGLAMALARLDRPEDYRRVLSRQALLSKKRSTSSPSSLSSYISRKGRGSFSGVRGRSAIKIEDQTNSLPDPSLVKDINQYLDIHLELNAQLRKIGKVSREDHVAQTSMLGAWCHNHGLKERAAELLSQANTLSAGMLTGKLWVADLYRIMGQDEQADTIELELLASDILPMPRVPAALAVVAQSEGQEKADAHAFRIAAYSNHPKVLPGALRHAKSQGLKDDVADLTQRLHQVSTLFMPEGASPSAH